MKNVYLLLLLLALSLCINTAAFAATVSFSPTSSPTSSPTKVDDKTQAIDQKINELKSKITNKVAQLKLVEKRGFIGTVTETTNTQITLTDLRGTTRYVDVDELTKFTSSQSKDTFGVSDIKKGMTLEILGLYNKESKRTLARIIGYETEPVYTHGASIDIGNTNKIITIQTDYNKKIMLSITTTSKIESYTKTAGLIKINYSKLDVGQHIIVSGFKDKTNSDTINVSRLIVLTELPIDPKINVQLTPSTSTTPATIKNVK